jgi:large subunit ribosomal protein L7Ae
MSVHVNFETPEKLADSVYDLVKKLGRDGKGRVKKGMNEVIKVSERGDAQLVVLAEDVNPGEMMIPIPMICKERGIPYIYVPSQEYLGEAAGLPLHRKTSAVAVLSVDKSLEAELKKITDQATELGDSDS